MSRSRSLLVVVLACLAVACPGQKPAEAPARSAGAEKTLVVHTSRSGLGFTLSNADAEADATPTAKPVNTTALAAADAQRILGRLPPPKASPDDAKDLALRDRTIPAPRAGKTITQTFPPPESAPAPATTAAGPLKVERHAPEGSVEIAPSVSMTFTQPMVPVTSLDELKKENVPAKITPEPNGRWRWLGTKTLVFQPDPRFPMATDYTVEVPAGVRSQAGGALAAATRWTFSTPAPVLKGSAPSGTSVSREPVMFVSFDQAIDPQAMLASMELASPGGRLPLRLATESEIEQDDDVRSRVHAAEKGRFLAFRAESKLPVATGFTVRVRAGAPSAEGPKKTATEQTFGFSTYGKFRLEHSSCSSWRGGRESCAPLTPLSLSFSNEIAARSFDMAMVTVAPEIPQMRVEQSGAGLTITGKTKGRTKYVVTVKGTLGDVHDQTLGQDATATFQVGSAEPTMFGDDDRMVVLDPSAPRVFPVYSINEPGLKTRLYAVQPEDWNAFVKYTSEWERPRKSSAPGRLVFDQTIVPKKAVDELVATPIDISRALTGGHGHAMLVVESTHRLAKGYRPAEIIVWLQATDIGLSAMIEQDRITGWATRLADGAPLEGADFQLLGGGSAKTGKDGIARVELGTQPGRLVVARKDKDSAFAPEGYWGESTYVRAGAGEANRWFVFDDRGMYKPGEEIHVKGWVRRIDLARGGDLGAIAKIYGKEISFRVRDPRWAEIGTGRATADAQGGFDFTFKLPANANLGYANVTLGFTGSENEFTHPFQIQEFRRPEFEVTAKTTEGPFLVGDHAVATVSASYYSGGGLADAPVNWRVTRTTTGFSPPNRASYHFGPEPPRWLFWDSPGDTGKTKTETWTARTNAEGRHRLRVDFDALDPSYPMSLDFTVQVEDKNRQEWAGRTHMLVHPASAYVGVKTAKNFVRAGEPIDVDLVVTDIDGKAVAGRHVSVRSARLDSVRKGSAYEEVEVDVHTCEIDSKTDDSRCSFKTADGGSYRVTAVVTDEHGRKSQTATRLWVMGTNTPKDRGIAADKVIVLTDKSEYRPGESAEVLVIAPFAPAEGVLTVRRQGIVSLQRFTMRTATETFKVVLDDALIPNAEVRVDLLGASIREDAAGSPAPQLPKRPAFAVGSSEVRILPISRTLALKVTPKKPTLEPGSATAIDVDVRDPDGSPTADAEVALAVVDEAVLALSSYETPDPLSVFYGSRSSDVRDIAMRSHLVLADLDVTKLREQRPEEPRPRSLATAYPGAPPPPPSVQPEEKPVANAPMDAFKSVTKSSPAPAPAASVAAGKVSDPAPPIALRSDFSALALFSPRVRTDGKGHATVSLKLPDNLTRYRVMAVASAKERFFGGDESTITARLPLMVRPSAPRFANFGDRFQLPIVIQNQTDAPSDVAVVVRATNAAVDPPSGKRVTVPPNDRVEVRFAVAPVKAGTARFDIGVAAGGFSDASQVEIPVYTPATTEAFATYGQIDDGAMTQPVRTPANVFPQFGGLEVTTSSTQLQALTDAVLYLVRYPYECNEQIASRVLAIAALKDVLSAFKAEGLPPPDVLLASMTKDLENLKRHQNGDGGWGFWQEEPWPYLSIHVAHALVRAREKGFKTDASTLERAKTYLRNIEAHIPRWYGEDARRAIVAYALYVRNRMGDADPKKARALVAEAGGPDKLPIEATGWIWPTISADHASIAENEAIRRTIANRVTETAGAAHFVGGYGDSNWVLLHSDRRADGVILEAMIGDQPTSSVIPKIVAGLLGNKTAGHWHNTQENAFVLLALDKYFATYEKATPDFVARVWLGDKFAGQHAYKGRSTERHHIDVPMAWLAGGPNTQNLVVGKDGPGRLYYRVGMQYAPTDLKLPPADEGFVVRRLYEGVDAPGDVKRETDGTWRVKAGAKVRVRLTMVATSRRTHVALVDPLPAGLEAMNAALAVTGEVPKDPKDEKARGPWLWMRTWYEHQNMRDERVEAFTSLLWDGVWDYAYVARATTPGRFVVPPAKAEEMYSPEVFGRSAGDAMVIE